MEYVKKLKKSKILCPTLSTQTRPFRHYNNNNFFIICFSRTLCQSLFGDLKEVREIVEHSASTWCAKVDEKIDFYSLIKQNQGVQNSNITPEFREREKELDLFEKKKKIV